MDSFTPENKSFREIIGNGKIYKVPPFQRDYSWEEEQWEELWYDIEALLKPNTEDSTHYLGYLVLKKRSSLAGCLKVKSKMKKIDWRFQL